MGFKWLCPVHEDIHVYKGKHTERAVAPCLQCKKDYKIWQYKVEELPQTTNKLPEKLPQTTTEYKSSMIHRPSKIQIPIDHVNWLVVLEVMDRGISTIKNKPEIKRKKGSYYYDLLKWNAEFQKIEEIAKVMKLMGDEEVK